MVTGALVEQIILSSGSLYLSPPQPKQRGLALVKSLQEYIKTTTRQSLRSASVESLLTGLRELNINTMWLQTEPGLKEWRTRTGRVKRLFVGDVEYESVIWANGIRSMTGEEVVQAFDNMGSTAQDLKDLYGIMPDRPAACHIGALDFLNDVLFALPVEKIHHDWQKIEQPVFRYLLDQPNPWQTSHRAHHAVDLLFLFGSNDMSFDRAADRVGHELRARWIAFINGDDPWSTAKTFAFGPVGECRELDDSEIASRRRKRHIDFLRTCDPDSVSLVVKSLAAGRISLLN
ncbi:hypothetical protein LTS08_008506 [Lithohypha guttulata]|nr:hypothetical protein LTS08_008506 [Lithohypha guttulata]